MEFVIQYFALWLLCLRKGKKVGEDGNFKTQTSTSTGIYIERKKLEKKLERKLEEVWNY